MFPQRHYRLFNRLFVIILREILLLLSICNIRRHFTQKLAEKNKKRFSAGGILITLLHSIKIILRRYAMANVPGNFKVPGTFLWIIIFLTENLQWG
jgi:hypothetical protein